MSIQEVILDKISSTQQHPFLFIGSGFTKRYLNTENWEALLRKFATEIDGNEFKYDYYYAKTTSSEQYNKLPEVASMLEKDYALAVFSQDSFAEFRKNHINELRSGISPLKIAISDHLKTFLSNPPHSDEIDLLNKMAVRNISGIITTNYDQFLESIFKEYSVFIGQEELIFSDIFQIGELYKIHGCVSKPDSIVITQQDYEKFQKTSAYLIAKILTIFLEYPIVFMGYSIQDQNILNILESIANCLTQEKLDILKDRFIFVEYSEDKEEISTFSKAFASGNVISMTRITTNNFSAIYKAILENKAKYNPKILRKLRHDIYKLAKEEDDNASTIIATGFEHLDNLDHCKHFIVGVGIANMGYKRIKAERIYEDIVLDNNYFDPEKIIEETLPELLPGNTSGLPMFKYLRSYNKETFDKIKEYSLIHTNIDSFLNSALLRRKKNFPKHYTLKSILESSVFKKKYTEIYLLDKDKIDINALEKYLRDLLKEKDILKNNPELKRLIRIYDWLKYKENLA